MAQFQPQFHTQVVTGQTLFSFYFSRMLQGTLGVKTRGGNWAWENYITTPIFDHE